MNYRRLRLKLKQDEEADDHDNALNSIRAQRACRQLNATTSATGSATQKEIGEMMNMATDKNSTTQKEIGETANMATDKNAPMGLNTTPDDFLSPPPSPLSYIDDETTTTVAATTAMAGATTTTAAAETTTTAALATTTNEASATTNETPAPTKRKGGRKCKGENMSNGTRKSNRRKTA